MSQKQTFATGEGLSLSFVTAGDPSLAQSIAMLEARKNTNLINFANAGHFANVDAEAEFNKLLAILLSRT